MKVAVITDQHFDCRGGARFFIEEQRKFYSETFFPEIDRRGIDTLFILGDTWEYRYKLGVNAMNAAFQMFFNELESRNIKTYIIYGNHDVAFKNTNSVNSIDFLGKMYPNIRVISEPTEIQVDGAIIGLVPWITSDNQEQCFEFIKTTKANIIGGHFEIDGFEMIPGRYCEGGISSSLFDRFDLVMSGHFHTISQKGNIHYISNSFWTTWSDYGEKKGFRILDTETHELELIENPNQIYFKLEYGDETDVLNFDYEAYSKKFVKVFVQSFHKLNQNKFDLFLEKMGHAAQSVEAVELNKSQFAPSLDGTGEIGELTMDNNKMVSTYIEKVAGENGFDAAGLSRLFFEIMDEAKDMMEVEG